MLGIFALLLSPLLFVILSYTGGSIYLVLLPPVLGIAMGVYVRFAGEAALRRYEEDPENYTETNRKRASVGQICAIVGIVFSAFLFIGAAMLMFLFVFRGIIPFQD